MKSKFLNKLFSWLLVIAMVLSMCPNFVFAAEETTSTDPDFCPHCKQKVQWTDVAENAWKAGGDVFADGVHYRLKGNQSFKNALVVAAGKDVYIDLAGFDLKQTTTYSATVTAECRVLENFGTLSIGDSVGDGVISGGHVNNPGSLGQSSTNYVYLRGGNVYNEGTFNLYGGTISGGKVNFRNVYITGQGGNYYGSAGSTLNMYGGAIINGTLTSGSYTLNSTLAMAGANICSHGTVNIIGGTISGGKNVDADTSTSDKRSSINFGGNIAVIGGSLNISGGTITGGQAFAKRTNTAATGSYSLGYGGNIYASNTQVVISGGTISDGQAKSIAKTVGTATKPFMQNNCNAYGGNIYISGGSFRMTGGAVSDGSLELDLTNTGDTTKDHNKFYGCGGNIFFDNVTAEISGGTITGGSLSKVNKEDVANDGYGIVYGGSIYVNGTTTLTISGNTSISGGSSPTYGGNIYCTGTLNVNGCSISGGYANTSGGNIYNTGTINFTSGTIADGSANTSGGNIYNEGTVVMTGGTITGGNTYLDKNEDATAGNVNNQGTFTMSGGIVKDGLAYYRGGNFINGGTLTLSGNAQVIGGTLAKYETYTAAYGGNYYGGGKLYVYDNAVIKGGKAYYGGNLHTTTVGGHIYVYGGEISDSTSEYAGSGVRIFNNASCKFYMYGGVVEDLHDSGSSNVVQIFNGTLNKNQGTNKAACSCYEVVDGKYVYRHVAELCTDAANCPYQKAVADGKVSADDQNTGKHTWGETTVTTPATCTAVGAGTHTCTNCGITENVEIEMLNHTDGDDGNHNCDVCGAEGVSQHAYDQQVESADALASAATCTENAKYYYSCKCGEINKAADAATWEKANSTLNHTDGNDADHKCDVCGAEGVSQHAYDQKVESADALASAATCTENAKYYYSCKCGEINKAAGAATWEKENSALGHAWDKGVIAPAPTCTEDGVKTFTCGTCGEKKTEAVSKTGHTEVTDKAVAATCTESGLTEGSHCSVCKAIIVEQKVIPATGHSYDTPKFHWESDYTCHATYACTKCQDTKDVACAVTSDNKVASCKEEVIKTYTATIIVDGKTYTNETTQTLAKLPHTEETISGKDATCTEPGLTEGKQCTVCGTVTVKQEEIKATGHAYIYNYNGNKTHAVTCDKCDLAATENCADNNADNKCDKCNGVIYVAPTVVEVATLDELLAALADNSNDLPIVITAQIVIPAGMTVELDLNGKTVNAAWENETAGKHIYALKNYGALTITDSVGGGSINSRGIYNYGTLTLNGGTINAIDGNGGYAVNNQSGSTFIMNGGVVATTNEDDHQNSSGGYDATALKVPAGATATLNGGKIVSVSDFTYAVDASGTLNIPATSTIEISGAHGAIAVQGGKTTIDAGTFSVIKDNYVRTDNVLYVSGGELVINGGTFTGDSDTAASGSCVCDVAGSATINGGTFGGSIGGDVWGTTGTTIKGGTFENLTETQHIAEGYELKNGSVVESEVKTYVAEVNGVKYESLQEAIDAAANGATITLLADIELTDGIVISADDEIVLDLNGYTISQIKACTESYAMIKNNGKLTITGNGKISFTDSGAGDPAFGWGSYTIQNNGTLVVENGTIENLSQQNAAGSVKHMYCAIWQYSGSTTINGGTISTPTYRSVRLWKGEMTINGGTFEGQVWVQAVDSTAKLTINNGSFAPRGVDGSSVFVGNIDNSGKLHTVEFKVTGGTFATKIGANDAASLNGPISGGIFNAPVAEEFCAEGYQPKDNGDGTYGVIEHTCSYNEQYFEATFEADAYTVYTCTCGDTYTVTHEGTKKIAVATVNGEKFESFEDAIAYANTITDGVANVTLLQDVTYGGGAINTNVVLDLNGKTITATGSYVFALNPGTLTVKDSSAEKTGMIDGTETVGNVFLVYGGALTIESGKIHANNNVIFTYQSSSVITINGGELKSVIATGNILYLYEANTTTTVNGGTFYGPVACYAGTLKVAGGTFATDVSAYCAYGKTTKLVDGMYQVVDAEKNIYIGENSYLTLEDALNAAKDGDVIEIRAAGSYQLKRGALQEGAYYLPKNLTIKGTVDGVVVTNGPTIRCESIKLDNIDFINPSTSGTSSGLVFQISGNSQITNCTMDGYWGGSYYSLVNGSLLIDNCVIKGVVYGLNISENYDSDITITNTEISGWTSFAGDYNVVLDGCNLTHNGNYGYLGFHGDARIKNCTFGEGMEIGYMAEGITLYIDNSTAANGASVEGILEAGVGEKYDVYLDGVLLGDVELPEIQIIDIKGSLKDTDPDLTFALNFAIKNPDSLTEAYLEKLFAIYGGYYVDYVLTISGLNGGTVTFNANGDSDGYLAGQYDAWSANWLSVPFEDVVVKDGEGLYIMEYAAKLMNKQGLRFTLAEVAEIVQNFDCGVYFTPEFLAEHPDLKVSLQLKVFTEDAQGNKIENIDVATNNFENNYAAVVCGENKQSAYYATLAEAIAAAKDGDTIELIADVELNDTLVIPYGTTVTLDLNGNTISQEKVQNAHYEMILVDGNLTIKDSVGGGKISYTDLGNGGEYGSNTITNRGTLTLESGTVENLSSATVAYNGYPYAIDSSIWGAAAQVNTIINGGTVSCTNYSAIRLRAESKTKAVNVTVNGGVIYGTIEVQNISAGATGKLTVNGGKLSNSGTSNVLYVFGNNSATALDIEIKGGEFTGNLNIRPSIGADFDKGIVSGGTFASPVAEELCAEGYIPTENADGTYGVKIGKFVARVNGVGYETLAEAIAAAKDGDTVKLLTDIELTETLVNTKKITLDLNGKTISGTDTTNKSFSLITNKGELTITDSVGNGKITLEATQDNGYNRSSSVISNTVGGKLIVESGLIEHLGGHTMAYAIDNLTNGKGTYAETVINGGTIKSSYVGIRQFLNGVEAENILTVNGGTVTGNNTSIFFQDPSANCNSGKLTVGDGAVLGNRVYISGTAGTPWNVEVAISAQALGTNGIVTDEIPETSVIKEVNGVYSFVEAVASVNGIGYATLAEAMAAAQAGDTIELLKDITLNNKLTVNKAVTIDGNGHKIIANHTYFIVETSADCTFKDITLDTNNKAKGVKIASGNVIFDTVTIPNSNKSDAITVARGATLTLKNYFKVGTSYTMIDARSGVVNAEPGTVFDFTTWRANVSPANSDLKSAVDTEGNPFFEAYNSTTYIVDLNKQTSLSNVTLLDDVTLIKDFTASGTLNLNGHNLTMAEGKALKVSGSLAVIGDGDINGEICLTSTGAVLTAPAGLNVTTSVDGYIVVYADGAYKLAVPVAEVNGIGYATLAEAIAAAQAGETVKVLTDIELTETLVNTKKITLDLNGKTISGTDTTNKSFSLITNKGELTITGNGKITLKATQDNGYNRSSSVISNTVGGKLIVESGTIEHLGGHTMAYAIDNLTNGKGTYAETVINGGTIKSSYVGIRQFLNGVEAENILTVNGGTVTGNNTSIFFQDPSASCNSGKLTVGDGAVLGNRVYISGSAGTPWNVEVAISAQALGTNGIVTDEIPETSVIKEVSGVYRFVEAVASVNGIGYATLAEAIAAAQDGETVVLLRDVTEGDIAVNGIVKINVNGCTVNANLILAADAKIIAAEVLTVSAVVGYKAFYTEGAYIAIAADIVAYVKETGVFYNTVQAALNAAATNQTVVMIADAAEAFVFVGNYKTLDLNGFTLTAEVVSASFAESHIIDSSNSKGLLVVAKSDYVALNSANKQLPVQTAEGIRFVKIAINEYENRTNASATKYYFYFNMAADNTILDEILANGSDGTGIVIRVKATWTSGGTKMMQYFEFSSDDVAEYAANWDGLEFRLTLRGVEGLTDLDLNAEIASTVGNATVVYDDIYKSTVVA